jgi:hypothetical protein
VRKTTTVLAAALALTGLSACGGDDNGGGSGGLSDALDAVSAGPASEQSFAYTDVAGLRDETELPAPGQRIDRGFMRWNVPASLGAPTLTQRAFSIGGGEGVDLFSADRFITIGFGGDGATRIDGFDGDAKPLTGLQDASAAEDGTVVVADEADARDAALGQSGDPLGDRAEYAAAAACLGDVLAAEIGPAKLAGFPADAGAVVAVGVRGGDDPTDVLCVVGDGDQAQRADAALRKAIDPDADGADGRLADSFASVEFATGDSNGRHWTRVEGAAKADGQLGALYRAVYQMMLPRAWFGEGSAD